MHSQAVSPAVTNVTSSSTQQHREPPPYPGCNNFSTPGYRQSYSGSETSTDLSLSSTENLSTSARQDPAGEETTAPDFTPQPLSLGDYSILTRLGYPECCSTANGFRSSSTNSFYATRSTAGETVPCQDNMPVTVDSNYFMPSAMGGDKVYTSYPTALGYENSGITTMENMLTSNSGTYSFDNCEQPTKGLSTNLGFNASAAYAMCPGESTVYSTCSLETQPQCNTNMDISPQISHQTISSQPQTQESRRKAHSPASMLHHYVNEAMVIEQQQEQQSAETTSELQRQLSTGSNQSQSIAFDSPQSTLGHERLVPPSSFQPQSKQSPLSTFGFANQCQSSPSSPSSRKELRRSFERLDCAPLTHSQPDLTRLSDVHGTLVPFDPVDFTKDSSVHKDYSQSVARKLELDHAAVATCTRATRMVEKLAEENNKLHKELEFVYKKISKLQKVEIEVERLTEAYEGLVRQSQKRETLEKLMRLQMEAQMKKVKSINNELKGTIVDPPSPYM